MINVADLPAVRAQLERDSAAATEKPSAEDGEPAASERRPERSMVLTSGKYYVTEDEK